MHKSLLAASSDKISVAIFNKILSKPTKISRASNVQFCYIKPMFSTVLLVFTFLSCTQAFVPPSPLNMYRFANPGHDTHAHPRWPIDDGAKSYDENTDDNSTETPTNGIEDNVSNSVNFTCKNKL